MAQRAAFTNMTPDQRIESFRRHFYPGTGDGEWNDWRWQLRHRIRDLDALERLLPLTADEREAIQRHRGALPVGITPYYAGLLDLADPADPIRRTVVPTQAEQIRSPGEMSDPLGEDAHSPVPGLVHTYPDKVLFLVTDFCATYCRYCTRSRMVGAGEFLPARGMWERALDYIRGTPGVRDVLLSGGDPFILSEERLEWLLSRLHAIPHVEIIRIGTKVPAVLPQRITANLVQMLRAFPPLWLSLHFTHPRELTAEAERACARLADAGVPMVSQTVLLKGVNDNVITMKELMLGLLKCRVKPYYLHQCDAIIGSAHFRTPIETGLAIVQGLHGHTTGYAVPHYMVDAPGGGGKVPLSPSYVVQRDGPTWTFENYRGRHYRYTDGRRTQPKCSAPGTHDA